MFLSKLYGLTEDDMKRIDKKGVQYLIEVNEKQLKVWSLPSYERKKIEAELVELRKLMEV